jgi:hypothetical protein
MHFRLLLCAGGPLVPGPPRPFIEVFHVRRLPLAGTHDGGLCDDLLASTAVRDASSPRRRG